MNKLAKRVGCSQFFLGSSIDRTGYHSPLLISVAALTISTLVFAFVENFYLMLIARFFQVRSSVLHEAWFARARAMQGLATGASSVTAFALVSAVYPPDTRAVALGILVTGRGVGAVSGEFSQRPSLAGMFSTAWRHRDPGPPAPSP